MFQKLAFLLKTLKLLEQFLLLLILCDFSHTCKMLKHAINNFVNIQATAYVGWKTHFVYKRRSDADAADALQVVVVSRELTREHRPVETNMADDDALHPKIWDSRKFFVAVLFNNNLILSQVWWMFFPWTGCFQSVLLFDCPVEIHAETWCKQSDTNLEKLRNFEKGESDVPGRLSIRWLVLFWGLAKSRNREICV